VSSRHGFSARHLRATTPEARAGAGVRARRRLLTGVHARRPRCPRRRCALSAATRTVAPPTCVTRRSSAARSCVRLPSRSSPPSSVLPRRLSRRT